LYFVKVDVQACFDTIEQTKLLEILRELISEVMKGLSSGRTLLHYLQDTYMLRRYGQVFPAANKMKKIYRKAATPAGEFLPSPPIHLN
jgi:telomerase reverse transcriptase